MKCQKCGFKNPKTNKFCGQCGYQLIDSTVSVTSMVSVNTIPGQELDQNSILKTNLEDERKLVTVLFTDVVNYTSFSERFDPEIVREIMNNLFNVLMAPVQHYEGTVGQLLGDGMMVYFGAPVAYEDHAQRACNTALEMQKAIQKYAESIQKEYRIDLKMRVGVNSGLVLAGSIGNEMHSEYIAIGDTVNLASRLQSAASPGGILVSGATYDLIKDFFMFSPMGEITVKGKEHPVAAYQLLRANDLESRFDVAIVKGLSRFLGRDSELNIFKEALIKATEGKQQVIGIQGEPGIGKSRLVREFEQDLNLKDYLYLEGHCLHYGNFTPYKPLIDILHNYFAINEGDTEAQIRDKITSKVSRMDKHSISGLNFIYEILSLKIEDESYLKIEPEHRRNKLFESIFKILARESLIKPVVITVEDLHWIDKPSEEFLDYFIKKTQQTHLMLVLTYRPEYTPPWKGQPNFQQVKLSQLSAFTCNELFQTLMPEAKPTPELKKLVVAKSGGNPLFVEEFVHMLREELTDHRVDEPHLLTIEPVSIKLPNTIQGLIASRMDRLSADLKHTIQAASIIGREVDFPILQNMLSRQDLNSQLKELVNLQFIIKGGSSRTDYRFKHALIQEVAYESLPLKIRKELHENVAQSIERLYPDSVEEHLEILAYHYSRGLSLEKALDYSIRAGYKAQRVFANCEAIEYLQKALELCSKFGWVEDGIGAKLQEKLGDIYILIGKPDLALEKYENSYQQQEKYKQSCSQELITPVCTSEILASHLSPPLDENVSLAILYYRRGLVCKRKAMHNEGLKLVERGLALPELPYAEKAQLLVLESHLLSSLSEHTSALDCCQKALECARQANDTINEASVYAIMGKIYHELGDSKLSLSNSLQALNIFIRLKLRDNEANVLNTLGVCYDDAGDWESAKKCLRKCLRVAEKIGAVYPQSYALNNLADILLRQGYVKEAIVYNNKAFDIANNSGAKVVLGAIFNHYCLAHIKLRNWQKAKEYARETMNILENFPNKLLSWESHLRLAEVHLGSGEIDYALMYGKKSLETALEISFKYGEGLSTRVIGMIFHHLNQWNDAEEMFKKSLNILEQINKADEMALTLWHLTLLYRDMNTANFRTIPRETIQEATKRATVIFSKLGIIYDEALAYEILQD